MSKPLLITVLFLASVALSLVGLGLVFADAVAPGLALIVASLVGSGWAWLELRRWLHEFHNELLRLRATAELAVSWVTEREGALLVVEAAHTVCVNASHHEECVGSRCICGLTKLERALDARQAALNA